jgi:DNA repair protein RadC
LSWLTTTQAESKPQLADHDTTRTIQTAAAILKIHFVDHLIIGA